YKTARRMPAQARVNENLQLAIYHLGLKQHWPELRPKKVTLTLQYLRHDERISTEGTDEKIDETRHALLRTIHEIQRSDFSPTPGPLCDWCGYRPICPMWAHEYKTRNPLLSDAGVQAIITEYFELKKQEQKSKTRLQELRRYIEEHYEKEGVERLFGAEGHITRLPQKRFAYDPERVRALLEPLGLWDRILSFDAKKLKEVLASLPASTRRKVEEARMITRLFTMITATKKHTGYHREENDEKR
ncbi:MAG: PD-(D/E)XK nuclease family protein, partial [Parcubacteria group bacterium]|nr:PD-(D/E)XK nuclease family protein [Parcubacteria group bacterium]